MVSSAFGLCATAGLLFAGSPGSAILHPDSLSRTRIEIVENHATVGISFQSLSLIEVLDGIDVDTNLELSQGELDAAHEEIESYLVERLRFVLSVPAKDDASASKAEVLEGHLEGLRFLPEPLVGPSFLQWMHAELRYRSNHGALERFDLESLFFREENPLHSDVTSVTFEDEAPIDFFFSRLDVRHTVVAPRIRRPEVLREFLSTGLAHVLALESLGLLCVLCLASLAHGRERLVLAAFFLPQLVTYVLGAFDVIDYPERLVSLAVGLSIAYIGVENLISPRRGGVVWEALGFGLLFGAANALALGDALEGEVLAKAAAAGYGVGFFVAWVPLVLFAQALLRRFVGEVDPSRFARTLSAASVALGLGLFLHRAGWLG